MLSKHKQPKSIEPRKSTGGKTTLAAPHVYRPQLKAKTLESRPDQVAKNKPPLRTPVQRRVNSSLRSPATEQVQVKGARVHVPQPVSRVLQSTPRTGSSRTAVQRFTSRVVQSVKFYPNLHPGAVEPINPNSIFRLNSFASQYRLHRLNSHSVNVPNQQYNFVRTREGEMLLHSRYRHPSIAEGKQVLYAGEIYFNNGQLEWWSNGSGHYQPYAEDAEQANLPMDQFYSFQQIIKGEHKRKKG